VRPALRLILALAVSSVACQRQSTPVAPSPPAGGPPVGDLKIKLSCPSCPPFLVTITLEKGLSTSLKVTATRAGLDGEVDVTSVATFESSNPKAATVTPAGVLTSIDEGVTTITARYRGATSTLPFTVFHFARIYPDEVQGFIYERSDTPIELIAHVDLVGADYVNKMLPDVDAPFFRFSGVSHGGFDLVVSRRGYQTRRVSVATLPTEVDVTLDLDPSIVRDRLNSDGCGEPGKASFVRTSFRPTSPGFFRVTSIGGPYDTEVTATLDGKPVKRSDPEIDVELPVANLTHELTLSCLGPPGRGYVSYLRPR